MPSLRTAVIFGLFVAVLAPSMMAGAAEPELSGVAAIADALLWGKEMPASAVTADLPKNVLSQLAEYRDRERLFHSGLTPPPGATPAETQTYGRRVGIERVVSCLFPRGDSARVAPQYALDADIEPDWQGLPENPRREAKFIDRLLADLPKPWLAPYLNLVAGHREPCAGEKDGSAAGGPRRATAHHGRPQPARAPGGGPPPIRHAPEGPLRPRRRGRPVT